MPDQPDPTPQTAVARPLWRRMLWPLVAMAALTGVLAWFRGEPLEPLDRHRLEQAMSRWQQSKPSSYRLAVQLEGRQTDLYEVEVRQGEVAAASRNGEPLPSRRARDTWSVEGMFETILADIEMSEQAAAGEGGAPLRLRAVIDPQLGLPRRYLRIEMRQRGANPEAGWQVLSFEPLAGSASQSQAVAPSQPRRP